MVASPKTQDARLPGKLVASREEKQRLGARQPVTMAPPGTPRPPAELPLITFILIDIKATSIFPPVKSISFINLISTVKPSAPKAGWCNRAFSMPDYWKRPLFFFFFQITCMVWVLLPRQTYKRIICQKRKDLNGCNRDSGVLPRESPRERAASLTEAPDVSLALSSGRGNDSCPCVTL